MSLKFNSVVFAYASILFASACGGTDVTSCPNDPPAMACNPSDKCCNEITAYEQCVGRNVPTICGADGKLDAKAAESLCAKESAAYLACGITGGETCDSFGKRPLMFTTQPANLDASMSTNGLAKIAFGEAILGLNVSCDVLDSGGNVVPNKCSWSGLLAPETLSYGPLPAGTYKLKVNVTFKECAARTVSSDNFQVATPASVVGRWKGTQAGNESMLDYTYDFRQSGVMTWTRVAQQDANASLFPGCKIERIVQANWQSSGSQLTITATSGTIERTNCRDSTDLVTPPVDYTSTEIQAFGTDNSGTFVLSSTTPRTLTITSNEAPPVLTLQ